MYIGNRSSLFKFKVQKVQSAFTNRPDDGKEEKEMKCNSRY